MIARHDPLRLLWRFVALLLLAMISVHAVTPLERSPHRTAGSAFSAETGDVSLRSGQRAAVSKQVDVLPTPQPVLLENPVPVLADLHVDDAAPVPGLGPMAPPPSAHTRFSPLSPRAPPAA